MQSAAEEQLDPGEKKLVELSSNVQSLMDDADYRVFVFD
jgi:hypothetical protein